MVLHTIWSAARDNDTILLKELLDGAPREINLRDDTGCTPAHCAAAAGSAEALNLLIERGADLTLRDRESRWTVLHRAVHHRQFVVARLIKAKVCKDNATNSKEWNHLASQKDNEGLTATDLAERAQVRTLY